MPITNYTEAKMLAHITGRTNWTAPAATWIGLYNDIPSDIGGGFPIFDAPVKQIRWSAPAGDPMTTSNTNTITWSDVSTEWGEVQGWGIFDSAAGAANLLWYGAFDAPYVYVTIGNDFTIAVGDITLTAE